MSDLDPRLLAFAEECVRELVSEVGRVAIDGQQRDLVDRLAKAMQLAITDEYNALVIELSD